jgi:hypothetical protein
VTVTRPTTATTTPVASSASSTTLFAASWGDNARTIWNDSSQLLYVKFGTTASATSYTVQLVAGAFYEFPQPLYAGRVDGIWASANGVARVTSW